MAESDRRVRCWRRAIPGDGSATVSWNTPLGGGLPVNYTAYATSSGVTVPNTSTTVSFPYTTTRVNGLTNGVPYAFVVSASNASGSGTNSLPSTTVTPQGTPNPVQSLSIASVSSNSVTIAWSPDTSAGSITYYTVVAYGLSGSPFTLPGSATGYAVDWRSRRAARPRPN